MKTALLISTYNWPEALNLIFKSIQRQTMLPDEILIADDGSSEDTKKIIEDFKKDTSIPVHHYWQEDLGFRKSKILNIAIANSAADYIVQIDGDCIIDKHFFKDHIQNALRNTYLYGARVNILPEFVEEVIKNNILSFSVFSKQIKNKTRTLHIPFLSKLFRTHDSFSKKFRGCNVSYWRSDILKVNGYNEDFEGWGREDSDLVIRMSNANIKAKRLRYIAIVFHLYHKVYSKNNLGLNDKIQNETILNQTVRCENGINKYL